MLRHDRSATVPKHIFVLTPPRRASAWTLASLLLIAAGCAPSGADDADDVDPQAQVVIGGGRTGGSVGTVSRGGIDGTTTSSNTPGAPPVAAPIAATRESLGRQIFFDANLSEPAGLACGTCHQERAAFVDPRGGPTSQGSLPGRVGARNTPSILYASLVPPLQLIGDAFEGGLFLDGRVDTLEQQAAGPFTNPIEMANPSVAAVMAKVRRARYAGAFAQVFGADTLANDDAGFRALTEAIAAFERTREHARFTSRYDAFLAGRGQLTAAERRGLALFEGKARCSGCHPSEADPIGGAPPMFTRFDYHNLGIPKNPANPFYAVSPRFNPEGPDFVDHGLGAIVGAAEDGKFRTPTLRNIALTAPYGHNGFFPTLRSIVDFYNSRDVAGWPPAEIDQTKSLGIGDLGLTDAEIDDVVAFLLTLTDQ